MKKAEFLNLLNQIEVKNKGYKDNGVMYDLLDALLEYINDNDIRRRIDEIEF